MKKNLWILATGLLGAMLQACQSPTETPEKADANLLVSGAAVVPWEEVPQIKNGIRDWTAVNLSIDTQGFLYRVEDVYRSDYGANQVSVYNAVQKTWTVVDMAAYELATCSGVGGAFAIAGQNEIFWNWNLTPPIWKRADVGMKVACHGSNVFRVSMDPLWGTYALDKFNHTTLDWNRISGAASKVALGAASNEMWAIARYNEIWSYNLSTQVWTQRPGTARDVAVTNAGVYILSTAKNAEGNSNIYRWNGWGWQQVRGFADKIYGGGIGIHAITKDRRIWRHSAPEDY